MEKKAQKFSDLEKECKKAFYSLVKGQNKKYKFTGKLLTSNDLLVGAPNSDQALSWENMEWEQKNHNQPLFDQFLAAVLRIGIQQGFDWAHDIAVADPLQQFRENWSAEELANLIRRLETIRMTKS